MVARPLLPSCVAEVLGTFLLVLFGCGAVHVAVLLGDLNGLWQVGMVWGVSIMLAIYVFGPISGAHINPAITFGLAGWGLFPAYRVIPYVVSQFTGAFLAAAVLFFLFEPQLAARELALGVSRGDPGSELTAMCYGEYFPNPAALSASGEPYDAAAHAAWNERVTMPMAGVAEFLATAILALVVVAVTEPGNATGPRNLAPVFIGVTVTGLICVIAPLTQCCLNPARDFGPRTFASLAGWGSIALPGPQGADILVVYLAAPIAGALAGVGVYQWILRPHVVAVDGGPHAETTATARTLEEPVNG